MFSLWITLWISEIHGRPVSSVWCPHFVLNVLTFRNVLSSMSSSPHLGGEDTEDAATRTVKLRTQSEDVWDFRE